ncbi:MAG: MFS transporter [Hyphomicrobiales bacterium]|nr:MFS transporter [Hyphomicrobiales bacterium]
MFVLLTGGFMNIMDISVVNVALPKLQSAFSATPSQIEWVAAAYVLAFALGLLPLGRLGDRLGRKHMFLVGIAAFTFFSALCGMATSMNMLILSRILQGVASAMIMPQILASVQVIFPPRERVHAFSYFGLSAGLASIAGPLLGGLLIGANLFDMGWRWIFLVNVPVGLVVIVVGARLLPVIPGHPNVRNDWGGIIIAALAVFSLCFPLVEGHSLGWPSWTFAMMGFAAPLAIAFWYYERWRGQHDRSQVLPISLLANLNFSLGSVLIMAIFAGSMGAFLPITLFLQQGFGYTPLMAGLTMAPFAIGVLVGSQVMRLLGNRYLKARLVVGAIAYSVGMAFMRHVVDGVSDDIHPLVFGLPLFVSGIGMNFSISTVMRTALADVPHKDAGSGSGALQTFQNLGSAFGIAIAGQIFFSTLDGAFAAGQSRHAAFVASLEAALIFNIAILAAVAVLGLAMREPDVPAGSAGQSGNRKQEKQEAPVPVEI